MKRITPLLTLFVLLLDACHAQTSESTRVESFNEAAKHYYQLAEIDLSPMTEIQQCMVKKNVLNHLDSLDWKLTTIDSFLIRKYEVGDLEFEFSFAFTPSRRYYFISLPALYTYLASDVHYAQTAEGSILRKPTSAITDLSNSEVNRFFQQEVFTEQRSKYNQVKLAYQLVEEFFGNFMSDEITVMALRNRLRNEPLQNTEFIFKALPLLEIPQSQWSAGTDIKIFDFASCGFFVFHFFDDSKSGQISMKMFFIAKNKGARLFVDPDYKMKYRDCYDQHIRKSKLTK